MQGRLYFRMNPRNPGTRTCRSSAMALTMKLGPLPM